ncbi:hypothetical protein PABG_11493 [Paracoccidioides brasiliensis Pb03]|nr:hypothetical protein PABG_11493 [Paracoccidioides brasiliensis Pb03]
MNLNAAVQVWAVKSGYFIAIHHRDQVSLQERIRNTYCAYHWGVLLAPKKSNGRDNMAYDVSHGVRLDNETGQDLNPERDWFFRIRNVNSVGQWAVG